MARRINLVPAAQRARTSTNFGMLIAIACAIIVFFGLGLAYYLLSGTLNDREQQLADVQQQRQLVEAQATTLTQYEELALDRETTEDVVQQVYAGRTLVADILDSLSLVVPETVWFDSLSISTADPGSAQAASSGATTGQTEGQIAVDGSTYTFEEVAQFLVRLQLMSALSEINLDNAAGTEDSEDVKTFSIEAGVINTQDPDTPLPVSQVEVEGL